jgi:hypothetical protein
MKWQVTAADAQTGEDRTFLIEAATATDAEASARQAGYLVSQVSAARSAAAAALDPLAELAAAATAPTALAYVPPAKARPADLVVAAPEYWGLRFGSIAFLVFAGIFYLAGLLGILAGLGMFVNSLGYVSGWGVFAALGQFLLSIWPLAIGALFHALSSACLALRDLARNSFAGSANV